MPEKVMEKVVSLASEKSQKQGSSEFPSKHHKKNMEFPWKGALHSNGERAFSKAQRVHVDGHGNLELWWASSQQQQGRGRGATGMVRVAPLEVPPERHVVVPVRRL